MMPRVPVGPVGFELSAFHIEARVDETDHRGVILNPLQLAFLKVKADHYSSVPDDDRWPVMGGATSHDRLHIRLETRGQG